MGEVDSKKTPDGGLFADQYFYKKSITAESGALPIAVVEAPLLRGAGSALAETEGLLNTLPPLTRSPSPCQGRL